MAIEKKQNTLFDIGSKFSLREILLKYLSHLPLFIFSMIICVGVGILYVRYCTPMFKANALMLVGNESGVVTTNGSATINDPISSALYGARMVNMDNEMEQLHSRTLLEKAVIKKNLNVYYYNIGKFKTTDIYTAAPFVFDVLQVVDSFHSVGFWVNSISPEGGSLSLQQGKAQIRFKWNDTLFLSSTRFVMKQRFPITASSTEPYRMVWLPPLQTAGEIQGRLNISPFGTKSTIFILSINIENPRRGEDILNALLSEYNSRDVDLKKELINNIVEFINDRLEKVTAELSDLEDKIKTLKEGSKFFDPESEYGYLLSRSIKSEDAVDENALKIETLDIIEDYIKNNKNRAKTIPTDLGIQDAAMSTYLKKYTDAQTELDKQLALNTDESALISDLKNQREEARTNILEAIKNLRKYYKFIILEQDKKDQKYLNEMTTLPEKERRLLEVKRLKGIKENLYTYLLQRREEAAISGSSTKSNYTQIDPASASNVPYEPRVSNIRTFTILLGLILPVLLIYIMDLLNDKVVTKDDIIKKIKLPVVGEISHVDANRELVIDNSRNVVAEQFRILRSNLQFVMPINNSGAKTILITSTISGEGKSFISLNLAAVLSITGKKVALLEFDLRKLKSLNIIANESHNKGLTSYLIGQTDDMSSISHKLDKYPDLDIYNTGPLPPNPAELMINERMASLFAWLKQKYDYIVLDTAPVGLVSDSLSLAQYADATLYIVRQRYTFKKQLDFIKEISDDKKLQNIAVVVNDVQLGGRYGYYGYGYGYGYGYMYRYGFGGKYGYNRYGLYGNKKDSYFNDKKGYFDVKEKPWWKRFF
jgi:capsular exopolysaccharide synthesis family protein